MKKIPPPVKVKCGVLPAPSVQYKGGKKVDVTDGRWNLSKTEFCDARRLKNWSYVIISFRGLTKVPQQVQNAVGKLQRILKERGLDADMVAGFDHVVNLTTNPGTANNKIDEFLQKAVKKEFQIILVILPDGFPSAYYDLIKKAADVTRGIKTVCAREIVLTKQSDQLLSNIAMKFNLKLGGRNHYVGPEHFGLLDLDKTMIVGYDVTHPSPFSAPNAPSIAGMVASVDAGLGQWPASLRKQTKNREEIVSHLKNMLEDRLKEWKDKHGGVMPENILVYRDGVSEGQHEQVIKIELPQLREACSKGNGKPPRITLLLVVKRHHTRFYPVQPKDGDKKGNTKPGTVVDNGVTERWHWDFFMQAHTTFQGTPRPTHYIVLLDEIFRTLCEEKGGHDPARMLENVTQSLCYVYGRSTTAVSICTPAYYADIVCERARCYLGSLYNQPSTAAQSHASGSDTEDNPINTVGIHRKLIDTMFYI
ncbi:ribonuclease H-like domain-containing protein [Xylariaceae sp. FL0662B]|nr:ribonuclease H-like domain-containing protein [Xylariaceae sp. FL0662B]